MNARRNVVDNDSLQQEIQQAISQVGLTDMIIKNKDGHKINIKVIMIV